MSSVPLPPVGVMSLSSLPDANTTRLSGKAKQNRSIRSVLPITYRLLVGLGVLTPPQVIEVDVAQELLCTLAPASWALRKPGARLALSGPWKTTWQAGATPRTRPADPVPSPAMDPVTCVPCGPPLAALSAAGVPGAARLVIWSTLGPRSACIAGAPGGVTPVSRPLSITPTISPDPSRFTRKFTFPTFLTWLMVIMAPLWLFLTLGGKNGSTAKTPGIPARAVIRE